MTEPEHETTPPAGTCCAMPPQDRAARLLEALALELWNILFLGTGLLARSERQAVLALGYGFRKLLAQPPYDTQQCAMEQAAGSLPAAADALARRILTGCILPPMLELRHEDCTLGVRMFCALHAAALLNDGLPGTEEALLGALPELASRPGAPAGLRLAALLMRFDGRRRGLALPEDGAVGHTEDILQLAHDGAIPCSGLAAFGELLIWYGEAGLAGPCLRQAAADPDTCSCNRLLAQTRLFEQDLLEPAPIEAVALMVREIVPQFWDECRSSPILSQCLSSLNTKARKCKAKELAQILGTTAAGQDVAGLAARYLIERPGGLMSDYISGHLDGSIPEREQNPNRGKALSKWTKKRILEVIATTAPQRAGDFAKHSTDALLQALVYFTGRHYRSGYGARIDLYRVRKVKDSNADEWLQKVVQAADEIKKNRTREKAQAHEQAAQTDGRWEASWTELEGTPEDHSVTRMHDTGTVRGAWFIPDHSKRKKRISGRNFHLIQRIG